MTLHEPDWYSARVAAGCGSPLSGEVVAVGAADRRVLAAGAAARTDLPAYPTSAMDGWAVAGTGPWQIIGTVLAGRAPHLALAAGQACGIATGAAIPAGTTAVVRREDGTVTGATLTSGDALKNHIRAAGEECRRGDVLVAAGTELGPAHLGLLAAAGIDEVRVRQRPRAAIVLFGDELVTEGVAGIGQVRDSLGPQLPGWIARIGADVVSVTRAADTLAEHVAAIAAAAAGTDIVITTGGTAAGPVDHLHPAVAELAGRFVVDSVAVRPGHPMALADLGPHSDRARWLLGLPGNPQSAIVALLSLGVPLVDSLLGRAAAELPTVVLDQAIPAPPHEHRLAACRVADGRASAVAHVGSAMLRGLAMADGFAVLPPGGALTGATVPWLQLPR